MSAAEPHEDVIFEAALKLPAEERTSYLDQACAGNESLRQRIIMRLFAAERPTKPDQGLDEHHALPPGTIIVPVISEPHGEKPGDRIGRYKLFEKIGEGGCGVVYVAEQEEPVRRRVALKVIKLGMDTRHVIARFEAERQALALMDHPNIAKVLDAGTTETGRPFFVMELVKGIPITRYCDEARLNTHERLKLFIQVCQAIQHAHQKGIIHRDIKPSNILVADHDLVRVPKVIDFGIAKATTDQRPTDKTLYTAIEQFIGTPAYMSPEQAKLSGLDIDTRSDIYSLGVLLYELLTGRTPFDSKRLVEAGLDEIRRIIREEEPQRPSTKLSMLNTVEQAHVANRRQSEAPKLLNLIRGDLDWIVMKSLDKDRNRRYETANGLGMDIWRFLSREPVLARPPNAAYRLGKAVRRNWLAFTAAGGITFALMLGVVVSAWQAVRATCAEHEQNRLRMAEADLRRQAELAQAREALAHRQAETNASETKVMLRRTYLSNAGSHAERGDLAGSLPWLVEALKLATGDRKAEEAIRMHLGMVLNELPAPDSAATLEVERGPYFDFAIADPHQSVALSADGRLLAITGWVHGFGVRDTSCIVLCEAVSGLARGKPLLMKGRCTQVKFSPDGGLLMGVAYDGAYVWQTQSGALILKADIGTNHGIVSAEFANDERRLLLASYAGASVWDLANLSEIARYEFSFHENPAKESAWWQKWYSDQSERYYEAAKSGEAQALNELAWFLATCASSNARNGKAAVGFSEKAVAATERKNAANLNTLAAAYAESGDFLKAVGAQREASALLTTETEKADYDSRLRLYQQGIPYHEPEREHTQPTADYARWSPDGKFIFYQGSAAHGDESYVWDASAGSSFLVATNGMVPSVEFNPNGHELIFFYAQKPKLGILDLERKEFRQAPDELKGPTDEHGSFPSSVIFSSDGQQALFLGGDTAPHIWDGVSWHPRTGPLRHATPPVLGAFSPDGTKLATITDRGVMQIWDSNTGQPLSAGFERPRLNSNSHAAMSVRVFAPDAMDLKFTIDHRLLTFANRFGIWSWRLSESPRLLALTTHVLTSFELTSDGRRVLQRGPDSIVVLNSASGQEQWSLHGPLTEATASADSLTILTAVRTGLLMTGPPTTNTLWSSKGITNLSVELPAADLRQRGLDLRREMSKSKFSLCLWDIRDGTPIRTNLDVEFSDRFAEDLNGDLRMEYSYCYPGRPGTNHTSGAVVGMRDAVLVPPLKFRLLARSGGPGKELELSDSLALPSYVALSPGGTLLAVARSDNSILVYAFTNGAAMGPFLRETSSVTSVWFSPDESLLAVLRGDGIVGVWNIGSGKRLLSTGLTRLNTPLNLSRSLVQIAFSGDSHYLVLRSGLPRIIQTADGKNNSWSSDYFAWNICDLWESRDVYQTPALRRLGYAQNKMLSIRIEGGVDVNYAKVFDATTGKSGTGPLHHAGPVHDAKFSPDERYVATASEDRTARVWDADTGEPASPPLNHDAPVRGVAFFPDGQKLMTGSSDGVLKVWSLGAADQPVADLELISDVFSGRRIDPNGGLVPISSEDFARLLRRWFESHPSRLAAQDNQHR